MDEQKLAFLRSGYQQLLNGLKPDTPAKWGKMGAQQMLEHVTDFFKVSTEKIKLPLVTPEEHLPKYKAFLLSDKEFRENTKAPAEILPEEPLPVRHANIQQAAAELNDETGAFIKFFEQNPGKKTTHPAFGELNFEEWVLLHHKHVMHHFKQFGLIASS